MGRLNIIIRTGPGLTVRDSWNESNHPRAENGQFGEGAGQSSGTPSGHKQMAEHHFAQSQAKLKESREHRSAGRHEAAAQAMAESNEHASQARHHASSERRFQERGGAEGASARESARRAMITTERSDPTPPTSGGRGAPANSAPHKRLYPAFTTEQLKAKIATAEPANREKMKAEIAAREAGTSKPLVVPQL